eukprot:114956-Alexandrium_andersonii.AAC.1
MQVNEWQVVVDQVAVNSLREDVYGLLLTKPLGDDENTGGANAPLHPQLGDCQMAHTPDARTAADADRRAA